MEMISVKTLRRELPRILQKVEGGRRFVILYRSRPVGEIVPFAQVERKKKRSPKGLYELLKHPYGEIKLAEGKTSADLIREDRQ